MNNAAIHTYISRALQAFPDIDQIWMLPRNTADTHLAIVSPLFARDEYPATVEHLYAMLWTMQRPVPRLVLHVLDVDEWQGWRGQEIRESGQLLYEAG